MDETLIKLSTVCSLTRVLYYSGTAASSLQHQRYHYFIICAVVMVTCLWCWPPTPLRCLVRCLTVAKWPVK